MPEDIEPPKIAAKAKKPGAIPIWLENRRKDLIRETGRHWSIAVRIPVC